jgi:hypothetical protein
MSRGREGGMPGGNGARRNPMVDAEVRWVTDMAKELGLPVRVDAGGEGLVFIGPLSGSHEIQINFITGTFEHRVYDRDKCTWHTVGFGGVEQRLRHYVANEKDTLRAH